MIISNPAVAAPPTKPPTLSMTQSMGFGKLARTGEKLLMTTGSPSMRVNPASASSNGAASHGWSFGPLIGVGPGVSRTASTRQSPSTHARSIVTVIHSLCGAATSSAESTVTVHTAIRASSSTEGLDVPCHRSNQPPHPPGRGPEPLASDADLGDHLVGKSRRSDGCRDLRNRCGDLVVGEVEPALRRGGVGDRRGDGALLVRANPTGTPDTSAVGPAEPVARPGAAIPAVSGDVGWLTGSVRPIAVRSAPAKSVATTIPATTSCLCRVLRSALITPPPRRAC